MWCSALALGGVRFAGIALGGGPAEDDDSPPGLALGLKPPAPAKAAGILDLSLKMLANPKHSKACQTTEAA